MMAQHTTPIIKKSSSWFAVDVDGGWSWRREMRASEGLAGDTAKAPFSLMIIWYDERKGERKEIIKTFFDIVIGSMNIPPASI
jgi:hypothetical protein